MRTVRSTLVQRDWCLSSKKRKLGHRPVQRRACRSTREDSPSETPQRSQLGRVLVWVPSCPVRHSCAGFRPHGRWSSCCASLPATLVGLSALFLSRIKDTMEVDNGDSRLQTSDVNITDCKNSSWIWKKIWKKLYPMHKHHSVLGVIFFKTVQNKIPFL